MRGIKTLGARMRIHHENTAAVIELLEKDRGLLGYCTGAARFPGT